MLGMIHGKAKVMSLMLGNWYRNLSLGNSAEDDCVPLFCFGCFADNVCM